MSSSLQSSELPKPLTQKRLVRPEGVTTGIQQSWLQLVGMVDLTMRKKHWDILKYQWIFGQQYDVWVCLNGVYQYALNFWQSQ